MLTIQLPQEFELTDTALQHLVQKNPNCKFEVNKNGELVIVPPTGGSSGNRNIDLSFQLQAWSRQHSSLGLAFDSSTLFVLPSGAKRSPDASWVWIERWNALTPEQQDGYPPLCPDFVVELCSPTDELKEFQDKMQEYKDNGANLGWLIDLKTKQVEIYRQEEEKELLSNPAQLSGEEILPGFVFDLQAMFSRTFRV